MRYVVAGYVFVLFVLALYSVQLLWHRRRLVQAVDRAAGSGRGASGRGASGRGASGPVASSPVASSPVASNPAGGVVP